MQFRRPCTKFITLAAQPTPRATHRQIHARHPSLLVLWLSPTPCLMFPAAQCKKAPQPLPRGSIIMPSIY